MCNPPRCDHLKGASPLGSMDSTGVLAADLRETRRQIREVFVPSSYEGDGWHSVRYRYGATMAFSVQDRQTACARLAAALLNRRRDSAARRQGSGRVVRQGSVRWVPK